MARIRTIKPEFFRHEALQDLEIVNPGKYPMMVFEGLWGHCDNKGRFEWKPRQLKLDILPFLPFDMAETLSILEGAEMVRRYKVDGKEYGEIPTFEKHQRLSGKELTEGEKFPPNPNGGSEAHGKHTGSSGEIPESQEGKGREREEEMEVGKEGNGMDFSAPAVADAPRKKSAKASPELQEACRATWEAYAGAYFDAHGTSPVRNAKVSAQVVQLVKRLGAEESPQVAAWFVGHRDAFYVRKLHDFGLLLLDAEKLRTEWATGTAMTQTRARQADRAGAMAGAVGEILNERRALA